MTVNNMRKYLVTILLIFVLLFAGSVSVFAAESDNAEMTEADVQNLEESSEHNIRDFEEHVQENLNIQKIDSPKMIAVKAKNVHTFEISFQKVERADGYAIFRKASNKDEWGSAIAEYPAKASNWKAIGNNIYMYSDTKALAGVAYSYKVEAYVLGANGEKIYSESNDFEGMKAEGKGYVSLDNVKNFSARKYGYGQVALTWTPVDGAAYYKVYQVTGNTYKEVLTVKGQSSTGCILSNVPLSEQAYSYTVRAYADGNDKVYSQADKLATVYVMLDAPKLTGKKAVAYNKISVSWKAVSHADGYYVYRKTSGSSWKRLTAKPISKLSYTDSTAQPGIKYYYTVRAVDKATGSRSEYDHTGISCQTKLTNAKLNSVTVASSRTIKLSWSKVSGAKGYYVYRQYGGKWKKVATVNGKTSYTYTTASSSSAYKYWGHKFAFKIQPYCSTYKGGYSNRVLITMKPQAASLAKASSISYNTNKISWKKLSGASGYKIYRKIGNGKWQGLATVSAGATSYSDKKAVLGKTYIYTVKPYWKYKNKVQNGYYNAKGVKVTTKLSTPAIKTVSPTGLNLKVSWTKVSGAQGYRVYRKSSGSKSWTRVATVTNGATLTYTDKKVKQNTKYTYTVRAYRKSGKTTYLSGYNKAGKTSSVKITIKYKKVTDKKSAMYGKTLKLYYDASGKQIQNLENIVGKKSTYYLYVNKAKSMVTVYYKEGKYYVPYKAMICSAGALSSYTPNGTFLTPAKYRWHELMGPSWGQWCTRIHGGVLFHSVFYNSRNNNNRLSVSAYNKLGKPASHGCIRLTAGDAKWIYDNCKLKTTVVIYSKTGYEPLKKPTAYKLPSWHTWDPTDPNMKYKCKQKGCH